MGIMKKIRKARREARAEIKAAKTRAKAEVKAADKAKHRQQKLLAKQEKALIKSEEKGLKKRRQHEYKMAKKELERIKQGRFNKDNVKRYAGALRTAAPLLLPLIYRGITAAQREVEKKRAQKAGVSAEQLASFSGHGAPLKARTAGIRNSLKDAQLPAGFKRDVKERLNELDSAIDNAEYMTDQQRQRAHRSISGEIDSLNDEIQAKLGA
ncbi:MULTISPECIES: DUF6474 family protein [Corynebacterium]|uniref:Uncharacterized protein n=1 Tax=Corynebacterium aurimucosum TaxID=169292 RepID=A0A558GKK7_9CORY|nr:MULTISPECIES: DUF6474 family protein [Corynebacterium]MBU5654422.1 hypothetical protein [Corynebacterium aurimucosum]MDK6813423.1 DUF6474 family protein [Corynebacterium sp. UMB6689]OFL24183.1 hypothetical protein HMPREF2781_03955 [Corynebacterium sp. HMSC062A03]OFP20211.1 hypothetical protein HMPREF2996_07455 [Corynebacterium sp. HMSC066C02]OFQ33879.1 hypothetical protein HMPREF2943_03490 [Corynebacterium sp. HMSC072D12]